MAGNSNRFHPLAGLSSADSTPTTQHSLLPPQGPFITANDLLAFEEVVNENYVPTPPKNNPIPHTDALNMLGSEVAALLAIAQETCVPSEEALLALSSYHPSSIDIAYIAATYTLPDSVPPSPAGQAMQCWSPSALQLGPLPRTPSGGHKNLTLFQGFRDSASPSPDLEESTPKLSPVVIHFQGLATTNTNTPSSPMMHYLHDLTTIHQEPHDTSSLICQLSSFEGEDQIGDPGMTLTSGYKLGPYDAASHNDPSPIDHVWVLGNPMPLILESVENSAPPLLSMPADEGSVVIGDLTMSNLDSPESEEQMIEDTPDVPIWDDTQEWGACKRLEACCPVASQLAPVPTEADISAIAEHTGEGALAAIDEALVYLEPNCLQLAHYMQ